MKVNKSAGQTFGWNCKTHYILTKHIANNFPELRKYATPLAIASLTPDIKLSQTSVGFNMAHYYDGKNFNSYDIVPQNASDFFFDNLSKALYYMRDKWYLSGMIKAGHALHFLQDTAVPFHTNSVCLSKPNIFQHLKYEQLASKNPSLLNSVLGKKFPQEDKYFFECFLDTYKKSSKMQNPLSIPKEQWNQSVQESLATACENTYLFLKRLAKLKDLPGHKQEEEFINETVAHLKAPKI